MQYPTFLGVKVIFCFNEHSDVTVQEYRYGFTPLNAVLKELVDYYLNNLTSLIFLLHFQMGG